MDDHLRDLLHTAEVEVAAPDVHRLRRRARRTVLVRGSAAVVTAAVLVVAAVAVVSEGGVAVPEILASPSDRPTIGATPSDVAPTPASRPEVPDGFVEAPTGWSLRAVSPDGTRLVIEFDLDTCDRPHAVDLVESQEDVRLDAAVIGPAGNGVCTFGETTGGGDAPSGGGPHDAGDPSGGVSVVPSSTQVAVDLGEPLAGRRLVGCGRASCSDVVTSTLLPTSVRPVLDGVAVRVSGREVVALAADGTERWRVTLPVEADGDDLLRPDDGSVLVRTRDGGLLSLDAADGATRWRVDREEYGPSVPVLAGGLALLRDRLLFDVVHAVDLATGDVAWRTDLPGDAAIGTVAVTAAGEILVGSVIDGEVPTVTVLSAADGSLVRRWAVTGSACEVTPQDTACRGAVIPGNLVAAFGDTAVTQLVEGVLQFRNALGDPVATSIGRDDGVVVEVTGDSAVVRGQTTGTLRDRDGQVAWTRPVADIGVLVATTDDRVVLTDGPFVIARDRVGDGAAAWRVSPGVSGGAGGGVAGLVATIPGLDVGIDAATGEVVWWLPNDGAAAAPVIRTG